MWRGRGGGHVAMDASKMSEGVLGRGTEEAIDTQEKSLLRAAVSSYLTRCQFPCFQQRSFLPAKSPDLEQFSFFPARRPKHSELDMSSKIKDE